MSVHADVIRAMIEDGNEAPFKTGRNEIDYIQHFSSS